VSHSIDYRWRGPVTDAEMVALVEAHGGRAVPGREVAAFYFDACGFQRTVVP
jgi:hypothetical protein